MSPQSTAQLQDGKHSSDVGSDSNGGGGAAAYRPTVEKPRPIYGGTPDLSVPRNSDKRHAATTDDDEQSTLVVGTKVRLKGEIGSCDTLIVQGQVEAKLTNRHMEVSETGRFIGEASVDTAHIAGDFEGTLVARRLLVVEAGGSVSGDIQYGRLIIEEGGSISGTIGVIGDGANKSPK